jgi:hypothetical protein
LRRCRRVLAADRLRVEQGRDSIAFAHAARFRNGRQDAVPNAFADPHRIANADRHADTRAYANTHP